MNSALRRVDSQWGNLPGLGRDALRTRINRLARDQGRKSWAVSAKNQRCQSGELRQKVLNINSLATSLEDIGGTLSEQILSD